MLRVDTEERKIGLSRKRVEWSEEQHQAEPPSEAAGGGPTREKKKESKELKGGLGGSGPLIQPSGEKA